MFFTVLQKFYHKINLLSIDVSLGACSMAYLISTIFNTPLSFPAYLVLATSVWCIYTLDHLLDAKQLKKTAIAQRHVFHNKHYQTLLYSLILISIITFFAIILWIPLKMIIYGIIGGIFVLIHILLVILWGKKVAIFVQKEFSIAFTYTIGIAIPSLSMLKNFTEIHFLFLVQCFLIAFANLCVFSFFDYRIDEKGTQTSIARFLGKKQTISLIYLIGLIITLIIAYTSYYYPFNIMYELILLLMSIILFSVFIFRNYFEKNERYRYLGDGIFLIPIIVLALKNYV